jgi:hypothetical protein
MRMRADRAEHRIERLSDRQHLGEPPHARRDRHHPPHPRGERPRDDARALLGKLRKIQMAMAVDQHAGSPQPASAGCST